MTFPVSRHRARLAHAFVLACAFTSIGCDTGERPESVQETAAAAEIPAEALRVPTESLVQISIARHGAVPTVLEHDDGSWRLTSPRAYPANATSIASMLAVLAEIAIIRKVAEAPQSAHRLSPERQVRVALRKVDGSTVEFAIGASTREETFVQLSGDDAVYAVRGSCRRFFDLSAKELRSPAITDVPLEAIERIRYLNTPLALELVPASPGSTRFVEATPEVPNFDAERASKNAAVLANLNARDFADDAKHAAAQFTDDAPRIELFAAGREEPLVVTVGKRASNGSIYLKTSESEQFYLVAKHLGSTLVPKREHFERSDAQMAELRRQAETTKGPGPKVHTHEAKAPTQIPKDMLSELRALAREQRQAGASR